MFGIGASELSVLLFLSLMWGLIIWPVWIIFSKAGFTGWLSLLLLVPVLNILVLYYVAFSKWPILKKE
ncbi:MAG: hypothetical protein JW956_00590 [Calditrichaceae bacterium]|nr:hypothetical protein [Calditrichaceae bacterium]HES59116.1 hypothetical protein [Caldithrix sp.]